MKNHFFSNVKGDLFGGLSSSIIALPLALAFGVVAFAPLGPEFASQGALACLYGAILTSFFASLFGGTPTQITGPTGPMSVMIAAMITSQLHLRSITQITPGPEINEIFTMVFFAVLIGGVVQVLLGISGGGKLIKYIPYPVIAGFMNGVALIIFFSQLKPFFGIANEQPFWGLFTGEVAPSWVSMVVGSATIVAVLIAPRFLKSVPGALVGLIAGLASFFLIAGLIKPELLALKGNPLIIGHIPKELPTPTMLMNFMSLPGGLNKQMWLTILVPAFTLGMLGAIDSLLTSLVADVVTKTRHNSRQELIGQGVGNMIAAMFGGLPGAGSTVRTLANVQNGGKTRLSGMVCGLAVFLVLMLFGQYARYIPYSVLAGILMVTASRMVDLWSFKLVKQKSTIRDVAIVVLVAGTTVLVSLMVAVGLGVFITMIMFIHDQIRRSVIKNKIRGNQVHSKKVRSADEMALLEKEGHRILVYQLDGSIFFGTADSLMKEIETDTADVDIVILDFRLVKEIDLTGVQILRQLNDQLSDRDKHLALSYVSNGHTQHPVSAFLQDVQILDLIGDEKIFADTDRAMEWAEDFLLYKQLQVVADEERRVDIRKMKIFQYLAETEIDKISPILTKYTFKPNEVIFQEGDEGEAMYLMSRGCVSILFEIDSGHRQKRIASFGEGVFFGDMSLLEDKPRSATAIAEGETELYALTRTDFLKLLDTEPAIASKIQLGIARELSARLRSTSDELRALEM